MQNNKSSEKHIFGACLPAGATKNHYKALFPPDFPLSPIEIPPSRDFKKHTADKLLNVAKSLEAKSAYTQDSIVLFGHSLGCGLALALANFIAKETVKNPRVIISGSPGPDNPLITSNVASESIIDSLIEVFPTHIEIPKSFERYVSQKVVEDFSAAKNIYPYALPAVKYVSTLIFGTDDNLCTSQDKEWWASHALGAQLYTYKGDHFGYMKSQTLAQLYRNVVIKQECSN